MKDLASEEQSRMRMSRESGIVLGNVGFKVSRLSYGTVFMGFQADELSPAEGAALLLHAYEQGVYFWDTSEDYGTHVHVAHALSQLPRHQVVISSKVKNSVKPIEITLEELGVDYLDILFVHGVEWSEVDVAMKVMGCGSLAHDHKAAISFVARLPYVHSLCIGMRNVTEIDRNVRCFESRG